MRVERRCVIDAEGEGGHHLEPDLSFAVSVEQFGHELAEAKALPHVPFGGTEPNGNRLDRLAGVGQLVVDRSIVDADVVVVLGRDFHGVVTPGSTAPPPSSAAPNPRSSTPTTTKSAGPGC